MVFFALVDIVFGSLSVEANVDAVESQRWQGGSNNAEFYTGSNRSFGNRWQGV